MRTDLEREMYELKETIEDWAFDDEPAEAIPSSALVDEKTGLPF